VVVTRTIRLAIESATDLLSVAAARTGEPVVSATLPGSRRHASAMLSLIEQVLRPLGAGPSDLSLVAVSDGPGSFTGLRVGIAAAKALALGGGIPLWTAPSLLVRAVGVGLPGDRILALSSALRGEVYAGAWQLRPEGGIVELLAPRTVGPEGLDDLPPVDRVVGDGPDRLLADLASRTGVPVIGGPAGWPSAEGLLRLIELRGGGRLIEDPAVWEPTYGRPAEAQAKWERAHGRPLPDSTHRPG
jgi:tRNA threonylcarbamoyladenosine biosynthesis protein TsaB